MNGGLKHVTECHPRESAKYGAGVTFMVRCRRFVCEEGVGARDDLRDLSKFDPIPRKLQAMSTDSNFVEQSSGIERICGLM